MVQVLGTNITSPLGSTSRQNYIAVKEGRSAIQSLSGWKGIPEEITASVFTTATDFDSMAKASIAEALQHCRIDPASTRTALILSTTKGDIDDLDCGNPDYKGPAAAAQRIADYFGIITKPVVVCNACISGANAQLLAARLIEAGEYDNVIVCGADTVSAFTAAGFLSFKALSPFECRPFDIERLGLNLGEVAATMIFGRAESPASKDKWVLESGAQTNDAHHVSEPAPDGDGVYRALDAVMKGISAEDLDCVCVHGTATLFNDQMESRAIQRAGLGNVPATALKGYYGHTLGAAGLVETIITMLAIEDGVVLPVRGFSEIGVSGKISISPEMRRTSGKGRFVKILSGFGGCNCALRYGKGATAAESVETGTVETIAEIHLDSGDNLVEIYKSRLESYPKFYKMDMLTKLAYVASELLLKEAPDAIPSAIILFNGTSSIVQDRKHIASFNSADGFFPSPSVFLYTLPNIAVGEIAIRHGIKGETALYILQEKDQRQMNAIISASLPKGATAIAGWVDCSAEEIYQADLRLVTIN